MTVVSVPATGPGAVANASGTSVLRIALLGCGNVGSAFAALASRTSISPKVRIGHVLVRDLLRSRPALPPGVTLTSDSKEVLDGDPSVVVELLGGLEPARTILIDALERGIPVVTANKSLLAAHGPELRAAASRNGTPLLFEAAVVAGVPFLGTIARRAHASDISGFSGIANGTSNYVLTRARDQRCSILSALAEAQSLGLAEPDPSQDIDGIDSAEKLVVLLQMFGRLDVNAGQIETEGIAQITAEDIDHARALGGTIKPVILSAWSNGLTAFSGPAFVPGSHVLASVDGSENAVLLAGRHGRISFRGPGAGPDVTAATVLDDVYEATRAPAPSEFAPLDPARPHSPETSWFVRFSSDRLPALVDIADLLASHGVYLRRTRAPTIGLSLSVLTLPCTRARLEYALDACRAAAPCEASFIRALED